MQSGNGKGNSKGTQQSPAQSRAARISKMRQDVRTQIEPPAAPQATTNAAAQQQPQAGSAAPSVRSSRSASPAATPQRAQAPAAGAASQSAPSSAGQSRSASPTNSVQQGSQTPPQAQAPVAGVATSGSGAATPQSARPSMDRRASKDLTASGSARAKQEITSEMAKKIRKAMNAFWEMAPHERTVGDLLSFLTHTADLSEDVIELIVNTFREVERESRPEVVAKKFVEKLNENRMFQHRINSRLFVKFAGALFSPINPGEIPVVTDQYDLSRSILAASRNYNTGPANAVRDSRNYNASAPASLSKVDLLRALSILMKAMKGKSDRTTLFFSGKGILEESLSEVGIFTPSAVMGSIGTMLTNQLELNSPLRFADIATEVSERDKNTVKTHLQKCFQDIASNKDSLSEFSTALSDILIGVKKCGRDGESLVKKSKMFREWELARVLVSTLSYSELAQYSSCVLAKKLGLSEGDDAAKSFEKIVDLIVRNGSDQELIPFAVMFLCGKGLDELFNGQAEPEVLYKRLSSALALEEKSGESPSVRAFKEVCRDFVANFTSEVRGSGQKAEYSNYPELQEVGAPKKETLFSRFSRPSSGGRSFGKDGMGQNGILAVDISRRRQIAAAIVTAREDADLRKAIAASMEGQGSAALGVSRSSRAATPGSAYGSDGAAASGNTPPSAPGSASGSDGNLSDGAMAAIAAVGESQRSFGSEIGGDSSHQPSAAVGRRHESHSGVGRVVDDQGFDEEETTHAVIASRVERFREDRRAREQRRLQRGTTGRDDLWRDSRSPSNDSESSDDVRGAAYASRGRAVHTSADAMEALRREDETRRRQEAARKAKAEAERAEAEALRLQQEARAKVEAERAEALRRQQEARAKAEAAEMRKAAEVEALRRQQEADRAKAEAERAEALRQEAARREADRAKAEADARARSEEARKAKAEAERAEARARSEAARKTAEAFSQRQIKRRAFDVWDSTTTAEAAEMRKAEERAEALRLQAAEMQPRMVEGDHDSDDGFDLSGGVDGMRQELSSFVSRRDHTSVARGAGYDRRRVAVDRTQEEVLRVLNNDGDGLGGMNERLHQMLGGSSGSSSVQDLVSHRSDHASSSTSSSMSNEQDEARSVDGEGADAEMPVNHKDEGELLCDTFYLSLLCVQPEDEERAGALYQEFKSEIKNKSALVEKRTQLKAHVAGIKARIKGVSEIESPSSRSEAEDIKSLQEKMEATERALTSLSAAEEHVRGSLLALSAKRDRLANEAAELQDEIDDREASIASSKDMLSKLKSPKIKEERAKTVKSQEADLLGLNAQMAALQAEINAALQAERSATGNLEDLSDQKQRLTAEKTALKDNLSSLLESHSRKQAELNKLRDEQGIYLGNMVELGREISKRDAVIQEQLVEIERLAGFEVEDSEPLPYEAGEENSLCFAVHRRIYDFLSEKLEIAEFNHIDEFREASGRIDSNIPKMVNLLKSHSLFSSAIDDLECLEEFVVEMKEGKLSGKMHLCQVFSGIDANVQAQVSRREEGERAYSARRGYQASRRSPQRYAQAASSSPIAAFARGQAVATPDIAQLTQQVSALQSGLTSMFEQMSEMRQVNQYLMEQNALLIRTLAAQAAARPVSPPSDGTPSRRVAEERSDKRFRLLGSRVVSAIGGPANLNDPSSREGQHRGGRARQLANRSSSSDEEGQHRDGRAHQTKRGERGFQFGEGRRGGR